MKLNITLNKSRIWALIAGGSCCFSAAHAQLAANTYNFSAASGTFTEIVGGTSVSSIQTDDAVSGNLPIGFTFNYCGMDYTELKASSNGVVTFDVGLTYITISNSETYLSDIQPALLPLWDDISGAAGTATYITTGTAPFRVFTLECKDWRWNYSSSYTPTISFQVKLYESTNVIEFIYRQETGTGNTSGSSGATIGIADDNTPPGYLVLDNSTASPTVSSTTFTTTITSRPASDQIYRFTPVPAFNMQADTIIADPSPFCGNAYHPIYLQVSNLGTAAIDSLQVYWEVDGVAQPPVSYSGPAITNFFTAPNNTATILLGDVFFPDLNEKEIRAWTYEPNAMEDADFTNDTSTALIHPDFTGVNVEISPDDTVMCAGNDLVLNAGNFPDNPVYAWSTGAVSPMISISDPGAYFVWVQDENGCQDADTVTITELPQPQASDLGVVDNGSQNFTFSIIGEQNIDTYEWDFGDGDTDTGAGPKNHTYVQPGLYAATATLSNDCNAIYLTKQIQVDPPAGVSDMPGLENAINLYPNPAKDKVRIRVEGAVKLQQVALFNLLGQKVYFSKASGSVTEINTGLLASGIYQVRIDTDKGQVVRKLEIRK